MQIKKKIVASFQPRRPEFEPRSGRVEFLVDEMALGQVFSQYFDFPCQFSFRLLHTHHLSSGARKIGQLTADIPNALSPTPPHGATKSYKGNYFDTSSGIRSYTYRCLERWLWRLMALEITFLKRKKKTFWNFANDIYPISRPDPKLKIQNNWLTTYNRRSIAFHSEVCLHTCIFHIYRYTRRHALRCSMPLNRQQIIATLFFKLGGLISDLALGWLHSKVGILRDWPDWLCMALCDVTNSPTVYSHEQLNVITNEV
jgi:hypothetical protein